MNKHELLKQADSNFQRGNRALARQYLNELLSLSPRETAAWLLLARVEVDKDRRIESYERALQLDPGNSEARLSLARLKAISPTLPIHSMNDATTGDATSRRNLVRGLVVTAVVVLALATTSYAIAMKNPGSPVAQLLLAPTPTPLVGALPPSVAAQTRAQVSAGYPQYRPLVDVLIGLAMRSADGGMEGAPPRPGAEIIPFDGAAQDAQVKLENALPEPGSLSSLTLSEQQLTSWMSESLKKNPDLPLSEVQVFLRDDKIQLWAMVQGNTNSTSALIVGSLSTNTANQLQVQLESIQFGKEQLPAFIIAQGSAWLNQWLSDQIAAHAPGLQVMNIHISNGLITLSGMR